jgi:hypothetical protein
MNSTQNIEKIKRQLNKPLVSHGVSLVRYGGLNIVKQKGNYGNQTYHSAPERHGYYAFLFPFIELFLIGSTKQDEFKAGVRKKFHAIDGYIWTHFKPRQRKDIVAESNGWYKVHVSVLNKIIQQRFALDSTCIQTNYTYERYLTDNQPEKGKRNDAVKVKRINPYVYYSTDHMEVFVCRDTKIS